MVEVEIKASVYSDVSVFSFSSSNLALSILHTLGLKCVRTSHTSFGAKTGTKRNTHERSTIRKKIGHRFFNGWVLGWVLDIFHTVLLLKNQVQVLNRAEMWNIPRQSRQRERNLGQLSF